METSAKTSHNVEESFLETSKKIYENIDKGLYDLTSEKSGIRVGNEGYNMITADKKGGSGAGGTDSGKIELGKKGHGSGGSGKKGGCC